MKNTKKLLAILLSLIMLLGIMPLSVFAETTTYNVGDIIEFGSYPQSEVIDSSVLTSLNALSLYWKSYGYYSGDGNYGSMEQGKWMEYAEATLDGNRYRAVRFSQYRPRRTFYEPVADRSAQDDNGYETGNVYWFKYEPIKWRILDPSTGLVLSETCIDAQAYSNTIYKKDSAYYNNSSCTVYANDYETSSIRQWLNDDFYDTAFTSEQQGKITKTTLESTKDKVFLLSVEEAYDAAYGFTSDTDRIAKCTDYAKAQGAKRFDTGFFDWYLRSPGYDSNYACCSRNDGIIFHTCSVEYSDIGVRPAMTLKLDSISDTPDTPVIPETPETSHVHNLVSVPGTAATCTTPGATASTICADCGAILEAQQTVDALGHNGVWKIDYEPTADHDGQMSCYCTRCNFCLESEVIERHKHDEGYEVISIAPTCTEKGEAKVICTVCGECIGTKEIEALGHDEGAWTASIAPTCMVKGEEICTCTRCGKVTDKKAIEAIGHDYSAWYTNNDGTHSKNCSICQDIQTANCAYRDEIHAPECATEGYTKHICDDCGYYYVDSFVPALGHDVVFTDAGDGTHIMTCNDCTITEVQGHVFGEWVYNEDGKFFKNGTKSRICDDCGCIETEEAKHTKWISHPFYPIIVWMGNVVHKILKVLSFDWFMPEITYKPSI